MAEFKLGRIRFVYQGDWTSGRSYVVDDVISIGGKSWICVINHTASEQFSTDQTANPTKWNLLADGTRWRGDWTPETDYNIGAMVRYGGSVYVLNEAHTSATYESPTWLGLEQDIGKWDLFATSLEWKGAWAVSTRYKVRDIVTYGGTTYVCKTKHISAATEADGLEVDQSKWDYFNQGITYLGEWIDAQRYKINDVVKYGASTWICTADHTSDTTFDETKFDIFVEGQQFENTWVDSVEYQIGDIVTYGGNLYVASQNNDNKNPVTETAYWDLYTTGFNFRDEWNSTTAYRVGDVVRLGGYTYLAIDDNTNQIPPNASYWANLNQGTAWTRSDTIISDVPTTTTGAGLGAEFNVSKVGTAYVLEQSAFGSGYQIGDVLTISAEDYLNGLSPANDITITVTNVDTIAPGEEELTFTHVGVAVTWAINTDYVLGDLVFLGSSTYICVDAHTSSLLNRPDADTEAAFWNLFAAGAESAVLTTEGDTYYFGAQGPTRLPIGTDGQVLRVRGGYPTWAYFGVINNLVYVAPTGTDSTDTGWGLTIDKPWKTIRYACDQIREGYQNRNAKALLEKNKLFMMREVTNWITYTYSVNITASSSSNNAFTAESTANLTALMPIEFTGTVGGVVAGTKYFVKTVISNTEFTISTTQGGSIKPLSSQTATMTGSLSYDSAFCERDTGYLVDAVAFDLSHGGNGKSTTAAKAYYTPAGSAYINSNFGQQITQTVAAYNYLKTLVSNVLNNVNVAVVYQKENGLDFVVDQIIDTALVAEDATVDTAQALLTIVTDGLLAGSGTAIPGAIYPNTTVSAKTGTYYEVLPIVIPNYTALTGDELRSTVVSPKPAIGDLVNDKPKTISALERFKEVIPNLVANNEIVASAGNTEPQQYFYNNYESIAKLSVDASVATINDIIKTNTVPAFTFTDPANYDSGFFNARRLLIANTDFLIAEVTAWIENEIATAAPSSTWDGFVYDDVTCERDVGYIIDALRYDLTYGGNLETLVAARSYYSFGTFVETGEKVQALLVWTYVKSIIDNIVTGSAITPTVGNAETQDISGTPGSPTAATFAQDRIQEIYDTIDDGIEPTAILPSTSWVSSRVVAANTTIQSQKTALRAKCISWITTNYPDLVFDQDTCSRDIGYIIDAMGYDLMFNSNFRSIKAGMAYQRGLASTGIVLADQLMPTTGVVSYLGQLLQSTTQGTDTLNVNINEMTDVLANGLTAVPAYNLPTPTAGTANANDAGYFNAARLVLANKLFLQKEVSAWIDAQILAGTPPFNGFVYAGIGRTKCERDIGYIVDALRYDLTYGGNLATVIAARSYYSNGVLVEVGEKDQAVAVQNYLVTIISDIATATPITKTPANAETQDVSGTAGGGAAGLFAISRIIDISVTIDTGVEPTTAAPDITWASASLQTAFASIQAAKSHIQAAAISWVNDTYPLFLYDADTCERDVGYIVDALSYDMVFGSNFISAWSAMSYHRGLTSTGVVLDSQLRPTLGIIGYVGASVKEYSTGLLGTVGGSVAAERISASATALYDVLNNGIDSAPAELITDPIDFDVNFFNARRQIGQNYDFIKADVSKYLENHVTYGPIWTALGAEGQAKCQRDIGYILDGIRYDLTYGGNTQSLIVGSSYYSYINLVIAESEFDATLAAYTHLKSMIDNIALNTTYTPVAGNTTIRNQSGSGDAVGDAAAFAQARVQDIIDWITDGTAPATIDPTTTWVDSSLVKGFTTLQDRKAEIQSDGLQYVHKFFQSLSFNETTCSRDIGIMVDAIGYDMMFNSNFASVIAGKSYYRALSGTQLVLSNQKDASLGLINFLKFKIKSIATDGVAKASTTIDDIIDSINGGATPRLLWPSFDTVDTQNYAGAKLIWENKSFIEAETIQYITDNYPAVEYSKIACARDVGYIVDAVRYDLTYGGNTATRQAALAYYSQIDDALQIDAADKLATLAAYANLKTMIQDIANGGLSSYTALQNVVAYSSGTGGDATTASLVGTLLQDMIDYIDDPVANPITETLAVTTWVDPNLVAQYDLLQSNKAIIQGQITTFIGENYPNLVYSTVTCERDIGYILDAIGYDLMFGSNFRSVKAGMSYYQAQASLVIAEQKRATLQSFRYLKSLVSDIVFGNDTGLASARANMDIIINILDKGVGSTPETVGTLTYANDIGTQHTAEVLRINKTFLENEATAWIKSQYSASVIETAGGLLGTITTSESHNFVVGDPVEFTSIILNTFITETSSTGNLITLRSVEGVVPDMIFTVVGIGVGALTAGTYYVLTVDSVNKQVTVSSSFQGSTFNPGNSTTLATVAIGGTFGGVTPNQTYYVATTPTTTTFTVKATQLDTEIVTLTAAEGIMTAQYSFDETSCKRDMGAYVDALVYDLQYPGNYKSLFAALLYNNAVSGSERSDMFWVSNSTGLRNCTLRGLLGDLTAENDYGTKRPTAGAFVALNPGFGPNDASVWVSARSHYSQNVTMFGSGCSGAKIDSSLHAGGNKSMVKNDFTTIISDGIGVWCTGADSLTELVSVFNYYGYAGYLAELGGRIRATNGNSSYGTYGVIAEGVSSSETPIYGLLDNRAAQAQVTNTVTDGVYSVLRMEFGNAGTGYTNTEYTINGSGYNAAAIGDEFRDGAVFETRIIDLNDDNGVGGSSYETASNGAQTGDDISITLAATDQALSAAYVGMRVQITAGTGVGQYANILTYETGGKFAQVVKDSFNPLTITGSTTTVLQVADTSTLYVGMPIYLGSSPFGALTANTVYYVESIPSTLTFKVEATLGGGAITGLTATSGQSVTLYAAGWDHTVPGTPIEAFLDLTTTYIIEPRINYTAPGYTATARTLNNSADWKSLTFGDNAYVAVEGSGTLANYSANGTTWASAGALATSSSWVDVVYGGGYGARATAVVGGLGGRGAILKAVLGVPNTSGAATADQVASVEIIDGGQGYETPPVIVFTPVSGGTGATATCAVLDGKISSVTITIPGSGYNAVPIVSVATDRVTHIIVDSWGKDYFSSPQVTLVGGGYTSQATVKSFGTGLTDSTLTNAGVSRLVINSSGSGYTSTPTVEIIDTNAKYVAIATGAGDNCYTTKAGVIAGSAWTAGTSTGKTDLTSITYGAGVYVAVGGASSAISSTNGTLWQNRTIPTLGSGSYSGVAYGNGTFVAISTGSNATAYSANGVAWTAGGALPSSTTWTSVAYGNGRFVAIASGGRLSAYSLDKGENWIASPAGLPSSQTWQSISYGQGLFFAVARGTNVCATSPDGVTWTERAMPGASSNWNSVAFGNIDNRPLWVAVSNTTGTTAASIRTGAQTTGRVKVASGVVTEVRMLEPGSGYPYGTVSATTATTNLITVDNTTNLVNLQPIEFYGTDSGGLVNEVTYYVIGSTITSTQFKVAANIDDAVAGTPITLTTSSPSMTYRAGPIVTVTDPNNIVDVGLRVRLGDGALGNPSFSDRGADNATATTDVNGDGYSDLFQVSTFVNVYNLPGRPTAGANVEFASIPGAYYKLVTVTNYVENQDYPGTYTATFQLNPGLTTLLAPKHGDLITTRIKYSQVRLTGHDYLYIGTGGFERTNYPYVDITTAIQANQELFSGGGRVFFTSTDQDGNFNVGDLFGVQQATGTATLNASAFNLSGLNSLQLGSVELGIGSAIITQFSTDPFFTADSDSIVPTQRAIRAYITAQIGGGQSSLNVNTLTSGVVYIAGNTISTTTGAQINVTAKMNFTGGIDGAPVALGYFLTR